MQRRNACHHSKTFQNLKQTSLRKPNRQFYSHFPGDKVLQHWEGCLMLRTLPVSHCQCHLRNYILGNNWFINLALDMKVGGPSGTLNLSYIYMLKPPHHNIYSHFSRTSSVLAFHCASISQCTSVSILVLNAEAFFCACFSFAGGEKQRLC